MDPASFTFENLSEMKFNDLYRMTVQFNLVKRRVKKQELIEKLLTLKTMNAAKEEEWRNGSEVFKNVDETKDDEESRRLTFNVNKNSDSDPVDRRLTFEVPLDKSILFGTEDCRSTYEVQPTKEDFGIDARATFEISKKGEKLVSPPAVNSRETYEVPMSGQKLINDLGSKCEVKIEKLDMNKIESKKQLQFDVKEKKIKSPVIRRTRKDDVLKKDNMKMSQKSILIKRTNKATTPNKTVEMIKSPFKPRVKLMNLQSSKTPLAKQRPKTLDAESLKKLSSVKSKANEDKLSEIKEVSETDKENVGRLLRRRKSKTEDNAVVKKPNPIRVNFFSPQVANRLSRSRMSGINENPTENRVSKIPKPTKMPDFASIHKRQFEQMDSLHDYKRKKEERARKLFGTPQPGPQNKESAKKPVTGIFQFKSTKIEMKGPSSKFGKSVENLKNASPQKNKTIIESKAKKDAVKNKSTLRMQTDIKDRNRSHIHGVRTNKRFELQMKFRNI